MDTWVERVHFRASIFHDQIYAARITQERTGVDTSGMIALYRSKLEEIYSEEMPLAKLLDDSELVVRAEGPGTNHNAPQLNTVHWLAQHVRTQLRHLSAAVLPMAVEDAKAAARKLEWLFMGYAPGSIVMGFSLHRLESLPGFEESDTLAFDMLSGAAQSIAMVPQYVEDNALSPSLADAIEDPALRDAAVVAAWNLSPTAQSGIHTVHVQSRRGDVGELSQRERMVLKSAIDKPHLRQTKRSEFSGVMNMMDTEKHRAILRHVHDVGSIRCILDESIQAQAKHLFDERVLVTGSYETNKDGRPRLMRVEQVVRDDRQLRIEE